MEIKINNKAVEVFNGARVKDAVLKYFSENGSKIPHPLPEIEDKYGNILSDDGELSDGDILFLKGINGRPLSLLVLLIASLSVLLAGSCSTTQNIDRGGKNERQAVIFAVNDMHAAIDNFPKLAYVVDSLRAIYPSMILVSAGDNQTGNPVNDQYPEKGLPMIELMNAVKFDLSAVGNHEFDSRQKGFSLLTHKADFPFICANAIPADSLKIKIDPFKIFKLKNGLKIAFLGFIQINENGIPDSHPDNTRGFIFKSAYETIPGYLYLKQKSDIFIVLSHLGFQGDVKLAGSIPSGIDLIIGGHSHTRVSNEQIFNGVLITQADSKLRYGTLIKLTVAGDGTLKKSVTLIDIRNQKHENQYVRTMVDRFNDNPALKEVIATATDSFSSHEQLGYLMADAQRDAAGSDIAFINPGGVRIDNLPAGPVTVTNIYQLDPFGNELVLTRLTGDEIVSMIFSAFRMENNHPVIPSGVKLKIITDDKGNLKEVLVLNTDGSPFDMKRTYTVAMNNYMTQAFKYNHSDPGHSLYVTSADATIGYLKKMVSIRSYRDEKRIETARSQN